MRHIHISGDDLVKYARRFMYGTLFLDGVLFFKIREESRERELKQEIYKNIKSGDYKYKV